MRIACSDLQARCADQDKLQEEVSPEQWSRSPPRLHLPPQNEILRRNLQRAQDELREREQEEESSVGAMQSELIEMRSRMKSQADNFKTEKALLQQKIELLEAQVCAYGYSKGWTGPVPPRRNP